VCVSWWNRVSDYVMKINVLISLVLIVSLVYVDLFVSIVMCVRVVVILVLLRLKFYGWCNVVCVLVWKFDRCLFVDVLFVFVVSLFLFGVLCACCF